MLKAILFDLGDTLLDFAPVDTIGVLRQSAAEAHAYLLQKGHALPSFPKYRRKLIWTLRRTYIWARLRGRELNVLTELRRLSLAMGLHLDEPTLEEVSWILYAPAVGRSSIEHDLVATLSLLRSRGFKLGLISNTVIPGVVLDRHVKLAGFLEYFPLRLYSSEVGIRKPDTRIFQMALEQLEVSPDQAMFVGDRVATDIIGARRAGMTTVLKQPQPNGRRPPEAHHVIRRIADLMELVPATPHAPPQAAPAHAAPRLHPAPARR